MTKAHRKRRSGRVKQKRKNLKGMSSYDQVNLPHLIGIFLFGMLLYANTWTHDYSQDDAIVIHDNMFTTEGLAGLGSIFRYDTFYGFFKEEGKSKLVSGGRYRPLSLASFALEWEIFGKNPMPSHVINSLLYGILGIVLYLFLWQFVPVGGSSRHVFALLAGLLYLAHPIHTEVVANIKGRDEILSMLLGIGSLLFSFRYAVSKKLLWALLATASITLACLSKENAINFVILAPLSLWFFREEKLKGSLFFSWPIVLGALIFLSMRFAVLGFDPGTTPSELMNNPFIKIEGNRYLPFSWEERSATILFTLGKYLQLLFFPHPLTHDYYPRHIDIMHLTNAKVMLSLVMYICLACLALLGLKKRSLYSYSIIYFLVTIFIISNIPFPVGTNMSERFMFMPSLGWALVAANALLWVRNKISHPLTFGLICFILFGALSVKTISRNNVWKNDLSLFTHDIKISKNSAKLRNAVGGVLSNAALEIDDPEEKERMIEEAVVNLQRAIEIHPNYKNAHLILGNSYFYLREFQNAEKYYNNALRLDPGFRDAIFNNAVNNRELGRYFGSQLGDLEKSVLYLTQAHQILNDDYETARLLGTAYGHLDQHEKAIEYFLLALNISPDLADAHMNVAKSYFNAGNAELGNEYLNAALKIDPNVLQ